MKRSAKWQNFYKWYCIVSCLLVAVVIVFTAASGSRFEITNEFMYYAALALSFVLLIASIYGLDQSLWIISLIVWLCRRDSTKGWAIFLWGLAMAVAKFICAAAYVLLGGGV